MLIPKKYVIIMGNRREAFSRALRYFIETGKNITQTRISKATGIAQGMISGMKTGKRYGTEESRRAVANFFGQPYEEFLKVGYRLLAAEKNAGLPDTQATPPRINYGRRSTDSEPPIILSEHQKKVDLFKDPAWGEYVNALLLEIEELDPGARDRIKRMLEFERNELRRQSSPKPAQQDKSSTS